jgi:hypothetical protein
MYTFCEKSQSSTIPSSVPVKQKLWQNTRKPSKLRVCSRESPWILESLIEPCVLAQRQPNKNK